MERDFSILPNDKAIRKLQVFVTRKRKWKTSQYISICIKIHHFKVVNLWHFKFIFTSSEKERENATLYHTYSRQRKLDRCIHLRIMLLITGNSLSINLISEIWNVPNSFAVPFISEHAYEFDVLLVLPFYALNWRSCSLKIRPASEIDNEWR